MSAADDVTVLRLGGGQLLLRGPALLTALALVRAGLRVAARDGIAPAAHVRSVLDALEAEAGLADMNSRVSGHADVRSEAVVDPSMLLKLPWNVRHAAASEPDRQRVLRSLRSWVAIRPWRRLTRRRRIRASESTATARRTG